MSFAACLAFFALLAPQDPARLLPVPEGWTYERLALPPGFAPEIAWNGVEDLSFAPGMFDTAAPGYFSYAMALSFEDDAPLDAPALERFLGSYYGGLYRAVAEGKAFANAGAKHVARVTPAGDRFRAHLSTFDAFTDGRALELDLELDVHATARGTELLGLVSPKPADAPIWKELRTLGDAWRAARPPAVFLNHVYVVVDRATYDALATSKFLREEFAFTEERAFDQSELGQRGLFLYGRRTFLEFVPVDGTGRDFGAVGIALGVERADGLDVLSKRLAAQGTPATKNAHTRELAGKQVPWFDLLGLGRPSTQVDLVALQYDARFLAAWRPEVAPKEPSLARADVLARYASVAKQTELRDSALFGDVKAVVLPLDDAARPLASRTFELLGYQVQAPEWIAGRPKAPETLMRPLACVGPQFRVVLPPLEVAKVAIGFELALTRAVERAPMRFGKAELTFSGRFARLSLDR